MRRFFSSSFRIQLLIDAHEFQSTINESRMSECRKKTHTNTQNYDGNKVFGCIFQSASQIN